MNIKRIITDTFNSIFSIKNENLSIKTDYNNMKEKKVKVIDEKNAELELNQFKQKISVPDLGLVLLNEKQPSIFHRWYDCYEDWSYEYAKDFMGWKVVKLDTLTNCKYCRRCYERDYRLAHPNVLITGYDFHYYFENISD